jgi:uncharacterized protein
VTLYLDASALVARHVDLPTRKLVVDTMAGDADWCSSALSLTEALLLIDRLTDEPILRRDLEDLVRLDWDRCHIIPIDQRCLDRAAALGREQPLRLSDAIHLAAADRLPRPLQYVTFDPAQIPVAMGLGFDIISS